MSKPDASVLKNSDLNPFLFAEVGVELNGSTLTMLSTLARLGEDPWQEAALWARQPKSDVIDLLTARIVNMPLTSQALQDARSTASRLVLLLPMQSRTAGSGGASSQPVFAVIPAWYWMGLACFWIYLALGASAAVSPKRAPSAATAIVQSSGHAHEHRSL